MAKVLSALTNLSDLSLFPKMRIWELMSATIGFLYHPNIWIRQGRWSPLWVKSHRVYILCKKVFDLQAQQPSSRQLRRSFR